MGTGDPQSDTYQASLGPAGTPQKQLQKINFQKAIRLLIWFLYDSQGNITGYGPSVTSDGTGVSQQPAYRYADPRDTTTVTPTQTRVDTLAGAKAKAQQEQVTPVDTTPVDTAITPVVEKEPDYSTYFDDKGIQRNIDGTIVEDVSKQTITGDDDRPTGLEPEPDLVGYDPSKGAPEKVNTDEMLEGLSWANHSQKALICFWNRVSYLVMKCL